MRPRNRAKLWLAGVIVLIAECSSISAIRAAEATVALEVVPQKIKLAPAEKGRVAVIARNNSKAPIRVIKLDHLASDGLSVAVSKSDPETSLIAPESAVRWVVEISQTDNAHEAGEVQFFCDYSSTEGAPENQARSTRSGTASIQRIPPPTLDKVLVPRVESAMKMLEDPNSGVVFVVIQNKSNFPVTIRSIDLAASVDLEEKWTKEPRNAVIGPQREEPFRVEIKPTKAVLPGKHLLLFTINAEWTEEGAQRKGSTIAKHEFDAGVLGSSAMLTAIGVPSFLLLPGFLMILVFGMLWNLGQKRAKIPLELKSPQFWALAILLSLSTAFIYPSVLKGRNYLQGYNFTDVYAIWFGSAGVAAVAWALAVFAVRLDRRRKEKQVQSRTFSTDDVPLDVLRKLGRNGRGFELEQVNIGPEDKKVRALLLVKGEADQPSWVAPIGGLVLPANASVTMKELDAQLKQVNEPAALADWLEQKGIESRWLIDGQLGGVMAVTTYDVPGAGRRSLVEPV